MLLDIIAVAIIGLIFGSFLNMLIYRLPLEISLFNPKRSICTNCNYQIKWFENIPVLSYIYLAGKCSNCKERISLVYPIVELLTSFVTVALFLKIGFNYQLLLVVSLFYSLIVLSFIDLKFKAVPDYLLIISLLISILLSVTYTVQHIIMFFVFAGGIVLLELFVTFYIQNIKSRILNDESLKDQKALGEGDVPIVAIIGGILGLKLGILAIFLSAILAIIPSVLYKILKKDIETPFIPFLTLALFIVYTYDNYYLELLKEIIKI